MYNQIRRGLLSLWRRTQEERGVKKIIICGFREMVLD